MARGSPQTAAKRAREQARRERRERKEAKKAARNAADSEGAAWQIAESAAIAPTSGGEFDAAYLVTLVAGSATREVVVEFATSGAVVSAADAEEATGRFLGDEEPPQHLVVDPGSGEDDAPRCWPIGSVVSCLQGAPNVGRVVAVPFSEMAQRSCSRAKPLLCGVLQQPAWSGFSRAGCRVVDRERR